MDDLLRPVRHTSDRETERVRGMKTGSDRVRQREVVKDRERDIGKERRG